MEVPELNLKECQSVFERDEFYENIQAPKFHDFCSSEDPVVDADAYFRRLSGRSPRPSTNPFTDQNAFKGTKESAALKPPGLPKAPLSSMTLNTDVKSSVPKASSAGLKKAKPAEPMLATPLTKSQEKVPSKNKMYQRVSPVSIASLSSPASDGKGNDPVQAPSTVKSYHVSENTDPNGTSQARGKVINSGGSKSDDRTILSVTAGPGSVQAPIHTDGDLEVARESQFLVKSQSQIPRPSKGKSDSTARRVTDPAVVDLSDVKDRKRKPTPRTAEAGLTKVYETRSRVLKQQRKSSAFSDSAGCSGFSDLGPSSSQTAGTSCIEPLRASAVKPPADRRTSRRSSDNSRRRRASGGLNARQGRRALMTGPKSNANANAAQGITGNISTQLALFSPVQLGSNLTNKQVSVTEKQNFVTVLPKLISAPAFASLGPMVTSSSSVHATEDSSVEEEGSLNPYSGRASNSETSGGNGDFAQESVQSLSCIPDTSMIYDQQEVHDSVGDLVLEKLQKLHLQQEDSEAFQEPERNSPPEAVQPVSCLISSDDSSVMEEVKDGCGAQIDCFEEHSEELTPADNPHTLRAGVSSSTGLNEAETESGLDASDEFSMWKVIPREDEGERDTTVSIRMQDIDFPVDWSVSNLCQATTVSGECMVAGIDQADVIESLQNLQIQSNGSGRAGSKLPCQEDAGAAIYRRSSLTAEEEQSDKVRTAEDDNEVLLKSYTGIPPVECKTAASSAQELKTGNENRLRKRLLSKGPSREAHCTESDFSSSKGPHFFMNDQQMRNNKRKSIELGPHRNEQRSMTTTTTIVSVDEQCKVKVTSQSSAASLTHSQLSSSVSRVAVPSGISGQHKKMKTTCPQPFRLRTEERGALKEVEFNKKVELYLAAKEKMQSVPLQFTTSKDSRVLNQNTVRPPRNPSKEAKTSVKQIHQHTQARAAERALFDMKVTEKSIRADEEKQEKEKRMKLEVEEETKRMRKQMVPHAQRMPFFDRPFKPHRSTKTLTVPNSPKFHSLKAKKTYARTGTPE